MHHSEQKCAHFCSEWCIVGYGTGALWNLWIRSIWEESLIGNFSQGKPDSCMYVSLLMNLVVIVIKHCMSNGLWGTVVQWMGADRGGWWINGRANSTGDETTAKSGFNCDSFITDKWPRSYKDSVCAIFSAENLTLVGFPPAAFH